jgi:HK97 family phage portal protein
VGIQAAIRNFFKESSVGPIVARRVAGRPVPRLERYADFAKEGYQKNVIAYRCVRDTAQAVASLPRVLVQNDKEIEGTHEIKTRLNRPSPMQSYVAFVTDVLSYFLIDGNSYLESVGPTSGSPRELYSHQPGRMTVIPGANGIPGGYRYAIGYDKRDFEVDALTGDSEIRHLKTFHPTDDWYGMSPIQAAATGINQFNESGKWNESLLLRGASRGGVLEMQAEDGHYDVLDDEDYRKILKRLDEQFSGAQNAGRWKVVTGGMSYKPTTFSPQDMDWINGKNTSARDVCGAFNYPCQLLGIPGDNTYSNYKEARQAWYENSIIPLGQMFFGELNVWWLPKFGDGFELQIDEDQVLGLAPRRESLWDRIAGASFLTPNEKRRAVGWEEWAPTGNPADDLTQPANELPLGFDVNDEASFEKSLRALGLKEETVQAMRELSFRRNGEWRDDA